MIVDDTVARWTMSPNVPQELSDVRPFRPGMVWIPGGTFLMSSDRHYQEEAPVHRVHVDDFWIDRHLVIRGQFRRLVAATGHIAVAEVAPDPRDYPGALPDMLQPRSMVFVKPSGPVDQRDLRNWWVVMRGADWRHPQGPDRSINGLDDHSVVHVAYQDAQAYAVWADKVIRTEAEWEHAARGGLEGAEFPWGQFPWQNLASDDGYKGTSPIAAFPPNGPDQFDMASNAWEWTCDWYQPHHSADKHIPHNPRGGHILAPPGQPVPIDDAPKMIDCEPAVAAQARSSGVPAGQWITAIAAYRKVSEMARRSNAPLGDGDRIWRHSKYA